MGWSEMWGMEHTAENKQAISSSLHYCLSKLARKTIVCIPELLTTPAHVGMRLLYSLGADLTPIPGDQQSLVRDCPQHRIQWFAGEQRKVSEIYCYDGRMMYLGCCYDIAFPGVDGCTESEGVDEIPGMGRQGLALAQWQAPVGWRYPGLLPARNEDRAVSWPLQGQGWCGVQEVRLAVWCGWSVSILRALHWPKPASSAWRDRPMGTLMQTLAGLRQEALAQGRPDLANAYRAIGLQTIGEFWSEGRREVQRPAKEGETVSLDNFAGTGADGVQQVRETVRRGKVAHWSHPEVTALVWASARRRVTRALLKVPAGDIIAIYGDAIYLDRPVPPAALATSAWYGNGKAGHLRLAWEWSGPARRLTGWHDLAYVKREVVDAHGS